MVFALVILMDGLEAIVVYVAKGAGVLRITMSQWKE